MLRPLHRAKRSIGKNVSQRRHHTSKATMVFHFAQVNSKIKCKRFRLSCSFRRNIMIALFAFSGLSTLFFGESRVGTIIKFAFHPWWNSPFAAPPFHTTVYYWGWNNHFNHKIIENIKSLYENDNYVRTNVDFVTRIMENGNTPSGYKLPSTKSPFKCPVQAVRSNVANASACCRALCENSISIRLLS